MTDQIPEWVSTPETVAIHYAKVFQFVGDLEPIVVMQAEAGWRLVYQDEGAIKIATVEMFGLLPAYALIEIPNTMQDEISLKMIEGIIQATPTVPVVAAKRINPMYVLKRINPMYVLKLAPPSDTRSEEVLMEVAIKEATKRKADMTTLLGQL